MELHFVQSFEHDYRKVIKGNIVLKKQIAKQLSLLRKNANHPSLRLHKLEHSRFWSISIDKSIRMLLIFENDLIFIYRIGKHDTVY